MNEKTAYQQFRERRMAELFEKPSALNHEERRELNLLVTYPDKPSLSETRYTRTGDLVPSEDKERSDQ